jgi:hypothetical protein
MTMTARRRRSDGPTLGDHTKCTPPFKPPGGGEYALGDVVSCTVCGHRLGVVKVFLKPAGRYGATTIIRFARV